MHFVALASTSKAKKCPAYVGNSCEANKNDKEQSSFGTRYTRAMMGGCLLAPLLPFSFLFLPPFFFFSLSSPILSPFLFPKTSLGKHAPGRQPCGWYGGHLGSICGPWTRVKHPYCAQKPQNRSPGEAKTQKSTKSSVARKLRNFEKRYANRIQRYEQQYLWWLMSTEGHRPVHCRNMPPQLLLEAENEPKAWRPVAPTRPWLGGV